MEKIHSLEKFMGEKIESGAKCIGVYTHGLKTDSEITETFAFTCGGPLMFENRYYKIQVECDNLVSEMMFEYYNSRNRFAPRFAT